MALRSAPTPIGSRANLSLVGGRTRKQDRRTEIEDLRMEVRAAGQEMCAMATRITNALVIGDVFSAQHFASRLWSLGAGYIAPEPEEAA